MAVFLWAVLLKSAPAPSAVLNWPDVAPERKPPNSCVVGAGVDVETQKGVLPFRRVASGISSIRRWNNRLRPLWECKKAKRPEDRHEDEVSIFHN